MQNSFMGSLMELSAKHEEILYLTADSGEGGLDLMYQRNFPNRTFNFGIAEENMVAAAAGMALCGKIPFVYTAAPFLAYRSFEFIRDDLCLQNAPVKLFGSGSGMSVSALGPTHHTTEDLAVLRSLPKLNILSPATPRQAYEAVKVAYEMPGPVYVRLGMNMKTEDYFDETYQISPSGIDVLRRGSDVGILTTGSVLNEVMDAAHMLEGEGISASVASVFSLKPFDIKEFLKFASGVSYLVTVEEHSVLGGLGSMAAEELFNAGVLKPLIKIGLEDCFAKGYGTISIVRKENGIDARSIVTRIREALS